MGRRKTDRSLGRGEERQKEKDFMGRRKTEERQKEKDFMGRRKTDRSLVVRPITIIIVK